MMRETTREGDSQFYDVAGVMEQMRREVSDEVIAQIPANREKGTVRRVLEKIKKIKTETLIRHKVLTLETY